MGRLAFPTEIEDIYIDNNGNKWFFSAEFNELYMYDKTSNDITIIGGVPDEKEDGKRLYTSIVGYKNFILLVPATAKCMALYDIESGLFTKIALPATWTDYSFKFMATFSRDEWVYMFGAYVPAIVKFNIITNEMLVFCDWVKDAEKYIFDNDDAYFRQQVVEIDGRLIVPFCNANALLVENVHSDSFEVVHIETNSKGFSGICQNDKGVWLSPRKKNGDLLLISIENWVIEKRIRSIDFDSIVGIGIIEDELTLFMDGVYPSKYKEVRIEENCSFVKCNAKEMFYFKNDTSMLVCNADGSEEKIKILVPSENEKRCEVFYERESYTLQDYVNQLA